MKKYLHNAPFQLEAGGCLNGVEIAYHTYGHLNSTGDNVVWVCHALTASSDVFEWWKGLFGENDFFNPKDYYIVCANVLGGCYGTTGPLSSNEEIGKSYFHDFPLITIRDIVNAHDLLRQHLGIEKIFLGVGGSLGGQQIQEWAIDKPKLFDGLVLIATSAKHSPWGIAINESQRMAIAADATWQLRHERAAQEGLKAARAVALLSYRHYDAYGETQQEEDNDSLDHFKASSYQNYQGKKLVNRFNAFTYWTLSKAMDTHNVGRGRGSVSKALRSITARTLVVGISSDVLFPIVDQRLLANEIPNAQLEIIDSSYGHDGFLVETEKLSKLMVEFIQDELAGAKKLKSISA